MKSTWTEQAQAHLLASIQVKQQVIASCLPSMAEAAALLVEAFGQGRKLLLCGNGGSAADCQHMAAEFVCRLTKGFDRPGLPAIALTTDTSFLTAFTNDCGVEGVFARQVQALGQPGDVLLGISTSGNSPNVLQAMESARAGGMTRIALTGEGGRMRDFANVTISVPSADTQHIQEAHLAIEHILCALVEQALFAPLAQGRAR